MNRTSNRQSLAAVVLLAGLGTSSLWAVEESAAALKASATISEQSAAKIALAKVPGGKIQSAELEREHGTLVWSFDISKPKSKDIAEVQVDAKSGKVVSEETETPEDQAREAASEKK